MFTAASLRSGSQIATKKALVVIDCQNEFLSPIGKLYVSNTAGFVGKLPHVISKFRAKGQEVVVAQTNFLEARSSFSKAIGLQCVVVKETLPSKELATGYTPGNVDIEVDDEAEEEDGTEELNTDNPELFLSTRIKDDARCCVPGTPGSEMPVWIEASIDRGRDVVCTKSHYSAFEGSSLIFNLRMKMVTEVYLCGALSNVSVYATALDAVRHGMSVKLIDDCLGYRDGNCHIEAMRRMTNMMGAEVTSYQSVLDMIDRMTACSATPVAARSDPELSAASTSQERTGMPDMDDWISRLDNAHSSFRTQINEVERLLRDVPRLSASPVPAKESPSILETRQDAVVRDKTAEESVITDHNTQIDSNRKESPPRKRSLQDSSWAEQKPAKSPYLESRRWSAAAASSLRPIVSTLRIRSERPSKESSSLLRSDSAAGATISVSEDLAAPSHQEDDVQSNITRPQPDGIPNHSSVGYLEPEFDTEGIDEESTADQDMANIFAKASAFAGRSRLPKQKKSTEPQPLGPNDIIGSGDSRIFHNFIKPDIADADDLFTQLKDEVKWQKMYHRTGEVPRLVAVQGTINDDGSIPIYRHPADESPPLLPFSPAVELIKLETERALQHPLNHVLIQLYRTGEDNISEHSDKTLDIVAGSYIVNYSAGSQRIMTLRTKKAPKSKPYLAIEKSLPAQLDTVKLDVPHTVPIQPVTQAAEEARITQKIPLPHNSLFLLGLATNQHWLHSIRADKRPLFQKTKEELAFGGERISLTFRYIGTYIDPVENRIWGQGATGKTKESAKLVVTGEEAEREGEEMIRAFGKENHGSDGWSWEQDYGKGFDVINFVVKGEEELLSSQI